MKHTTTRKKRKRYVRLAGWLIFWAGPAAVVYGNDWNYGGKFGPVTFPDYYEHTIVLVSKGSKQGLIKVKSVSHTNPFTWRKCLGMLAVKEVNSIESPATCMDFSGLIKTGVK